MGETALPEPHENIGRCDFIAGSKPWKVQGPEGLRQPPSAAAPAGREGPSLTHSASCLLRPRHLALEHRHGDLCGRCPGSAKPP